MSGRPEIFRTVREVRTAVAEKRRRGRVGLVPTMGALHEGHLALVREARRLSGWTLVSIFVNPTQFGPGEDLSRYPRDEAGDLAKLAGEGAHAVFAPSVEEMYPEGFATRISVSGPAEGLETDFRPHFFTGVATVVAKLLLATGPDLAIFGEKDYQQLTVIRRMVADLAIPVEIIGHPTIREPDGLALSSRNVYLTPEERRIAPRLYATMAEAAAGIRSQGEPMEILLAARRALSEAGFRLDYMELRHALTLQPVGDPRNDPARLLAAAWLGKTRLIDNLPV
ncbi:MAG TPA: pantoate--beta-alanine ligase [Bauldia sp.]|nr:pantoate--beta-alanine ligase [Bauldia sp.]